MRFILTSHEWGDYCRFFNWQQWLKTLPLFIGQVSKGVEEQESYWVAQRDNP